MKVSAALVIEAKASAEKIASKIAVPYTTERVE